MILNLLPRAKERLSRTKTVFFLIAFSIGMAMIGVVAANAILDLTQTFGIAVQQAKNNLDAVTTARASTMAMEQSLYHLIEAQTPAEARTSAVSAIKGASFLDESLQKLSSILPDDRKVEELNHLNEKVKPIRLEVIQSGMQNNTPHALSKLREISPMTLKIDELSQEILTNSQEHLVSVARQNSERGVRTVWMLSGIIAVILAGSFFVVLSNLKLQAHRQRHLEQLKESNQKLQEAQNQLLQSEKMASIGQLAAGVAHEINNPIGFVSSNLGALETYIDGLFEVLHAYEKIEATLAKDNPSSLPPLVELKKRVDLSYLAEDIPQLLRESRDGIVRVKKIVQDLKDFSHVDTSDEWQYSDIHKGLDSTLNIVWSELKYKAEVVKEYGDLPEISCLPSQLNQVFLNMLINASHAIKERGTITVRTGHEGDQIWVDILDTGEGIPPENLSRIFDPFYTTKPIGTGTGLGLSLSYGIIQKHGGKIEVTSDIGKGTTFRIWLPVAHQSS